MERKFLYFFQYDLDVVKSTWQHQLQFTSNAQVSKHSTYIHTCKIRHTLVSTYANEYTGNSIKGDITCCFVATWHYITPLLDLCSVANLAFKNWFITTALLLLAVLGQACVSWPIGEDRLFGRGDLKRQKWGLRENTVLKYWTTWEHWGLWRKPGKGQPHQTNEVLRMMWKDVRVHIVKCSEADERIQSLAIKSVVMY